MNEEYKKYLQNSRKNKVSEHFTVFEIVNSSTAIIKNIDNRPTTQIIKNATLLIKNVLEPIRIHFNSPVDINSIYRSPDLNKAVGGAVDKDGKPISQHCYGQAADFTVRGHSVEEVFLWVKNNLIFDQLIHEGTWVHVSFNPIKNRHQALRLINGKYIPA